MATLVSVVSKSKACHLFHNSSVLLLVLFYLATNLCSSYAELQQLPSTSIEKESFQSLGKSSQGCNNLHKYKTSESKCAYLRSAINCKPKGYIDYLQFFYCTCGTYQIIAYTSLLLWLILLFYLLGNTAAIYFCSNLEGLSALLKLPPTIAGVTLLSLGNGAPDIFATIVSVTGTSTNSIGLNVILGGSFFVTSTVVGTISICISPRKISVDKSSFIRDILFLLFVLLILLLILVAGKITIWGAMAFTSLYIAYVLLVSVTHHYWKKDGLLPIYNRSSSYALLDSDANLAEPLLGSAVTATTKGGLRTDEVMINSNCNNFSKILYFLEFPLYLPRRLTIPDVCEERWSKPFAVVSITLAPILLSALWNSKREEFGSEKSIVIYVIGVLIGLIIAIAALLKLNKSSPPQRFIFPWFAGGFLMSVVWTYIIAEELVSLLVSFATILGINPSALGLTVLAWGNSLGDLIANLAVAKNGGPPGAQVAISGCYAGPIFNTLVGLGLSLVLSSWSQYPSPCAIPKDSTLFETIGFLISGLLWALVILPRRGMQLDRVLGVGLLCIYLCFLSVRFSQYLWPLDL